MGGAPQAKETKEMHRCPLQREFFFERSDQRGRQQQFHTSSSNATLSFHHLLIFRLFTPFQPPHFIQWLTQVSLSICRGGE